MITLSLGNGMTIDLPKYNYTAEQIERLYSLITTYQFEFDTPEIRKQMKISVIDLASEMIKKCRDEKIKIII